MQRLLAEARLEPAAQARVDQRARSLVQAVRDRKAEQGLMEAFMQEYDLSSEEGVVLMCLAEALLRIPDDDTAEKLIADKLGDADWESHLGKSSSVLVNASTWGLMLTGKLIALSDSTQSNFRTTLRRLINRSGEPMVRTAIRQAMRIMGHQYVMGRTIEDALDRSQNKKNRAYRYSFDMLGEAALTRADSDRYLQAYRAAITAIGSRQPARRHFCRAQHLGKAFRTASPLRARPAPPRAPRTDPAVARTGATGHGQPHGPDGRHGRGRSPDADAGCFRRGAAGAGPGGLEWFRPGAADLSEARFGRHRLAG